jgi:hypothetical protein
MLGQVDQRVETELLEDRESFKDVASQLILQFFLEFA